MSRLLWICLGGALGSGARYLVTLALLRVFGAAFPVGTLAVNLLGSFLLALVLSLPVGTPSLLSEEVRLVLAAGVLGGFTTYSTFSYETFRFVQQGAFGTALLYAGATVLACLLGCAAGFAAGRSFG